MKINLEMRPLSGGLGTEILGYAFDGQADADVAQFLRQALIEHHLLLFRGRTLDPTRQIAFTKLFGDVVHTCSPRSRYLPEFPEIVRVCNREGQGLVNVGPYWHSDGAYLQDPTAISIHHIIVPTADGETHYADLAAAYERLSPGEQQQISAMKTRSQSGVLQPLVRPHPVTGRLGLYVNLGGGTTIVDECGHEDRNVSTFVDQNLSREGTFYRHTWRAGDLVVVDNFAAAHRATRADPVALRVLHRTSIHGPSVWWARASGAARPASQRIQGANRAAARSVGSLDEILGRVPAKWCRAE